MISNLTVSSDEISFLLTQITFLSPLIFWHVVSQFCISLLRSLTFLRLISKVCATICYTFDFSHSLASTELEFEWSYVKQAIHSGVSQFVPIVR